MKKIGFIVHKKLKGNKKIHSEIASAFSNDHEVKYFTLKKFLFESPSVKVSVAMDGEFTGYTPLKIYVVKNALVFLM